MAGCPFDLDHELIDQAASGKTVPGYPRVSTAERGNVLSFLDKQLYAQLLEQMAPKLWWMAKQDSRSISSLHRQIVRSRSIVITEDPKLHLVWFNNRIFIKPLPDYLLSHDFWMQYLVNPKTDQERKIRQAALGFLRSWFYLIEHPSDFSIAIRDDTRLIPKGVTYEQFCRFSQKLSIIKDEDVTLRYAYGEIRLSRLNFYVKFIGGRWSYHRTELQYGAYFARFYGPFLFLFGFLNLVLSAMQTELAAEQIPNVEPWHAFQAASRGFTIFSLFLILLIVCTFASLWLYKIVKEWRFALADRYVRKKQFHETTKMELKKRATGDTV